MAFLAVLPSISTQMFVEPLLFALKGIPHINMKKKPLLIMPISLLFSQHWA